MAAINRLREKYPWLLPLHAGEGGIVFFGDVFSKFLTFLITLLLLSLVTPIEYKLYGVFITVLATVNQFTDSGLHQSFIRFYALNNETNPARAALYLRFSYRVKWMLTITVGCILLVFAPVIADVLLATPELTGPIRVLSIGAIGSGIFEFIQAVFQARQEFKRLTMIRICEGFLKLLFIVIALTAGLFSLDVVYAAYIVAPILTTAWGLVLARPGSVFSAIDNVRVIGKEMFEFGKWMMLTSFATMFLMRIDVFMISGILADRSYESGLYIAAARLCTPFVVLAGSVSTIFFPKAMELRNYAQMRRYVMKSFQVTIPLVAMSALYLLGMIFIIPRWFPNYTGALPLFAVLFIGYAWTIFGNPLTILVLTINRARVVTYISVVQLAVTIASHYWFITHYGGLGAAVSTVLLWFLAGLASLSYLYKNRHAIDTEAGQ
jgi:O-antigen/teichoic acid export membrane protein